METALREAWEEVGIPADAVEVLGLLDDTATRATPFVITPVVGIIRTRWTSSRTAARSSA